MGRMDKVEFARSEETESATFVKFANKNQYLHLTNKLGASVVIGFSDRAFAGRWLMEHYPGESGRHIVCRKEISIETASMLWMPYLIIIKRMDMDLNLADLEEYYRDLEKTYQKKSAQGIIGHFYK